LPSKNVDYKIFILSIVLYGCETWLLTLREEHRATVFEDRVLRRIFGPQRDEVENGENCIIRSSIAPKKIL
jgi:hypothetical protein